MTDILNLGLPDRIARILSEHEIRTTEKLISYYRRELSSLRGLGPKSLNIIEEALTENHLSLVEDPFGPYTCARHGQPRGDVSLESLYLCDDCAAEFQDVPFRGTAPEYVGPPVQGYCLHCNSRFDNVRLRQWYLCGICGRVVRSIGRSVVADSYLQRWWETTIRPDFPIFA